MASKKLSWTEKLDADHDLPKVEEIPPGMMKSNPNGGTMVIPAPREVDSIMKRVPRGRVVTVDLIRKTLASAHGTDLACPLTTGIFSLIAARAAEEQAVAGVKSTTPYWRTLKAKGLINEKFPGGAAQQIHLLEGEGHKIIRKGDKYYVAEFDKKLADL